MGLIILILLGLIFLAMAILVRRGARTMPIETRKRWGINLIVISTSLPLLGFLGWLNFDAIYAHLAGDAFGSGGMVDYTTHELLRLAIRASVVIGLIGTTAGTYLIKA